MEEGTGKGEALGGSVSECTVAESAVEQTLGQAQGSSGDGFEGNGDDLMVEILGSEVYVGGVCTSGNGDNLEDSVPERAENGELGLGDTGVSGSRGIKNEGSLGVPESVEEEEEEKVLGVTRNVGVEESEEGRNPESSCAVEGSVSVNVQVDAVSNAELITSEGGAEEETRKEVLVEDKQEIDIREETVQELEIEKADEIGDPVLGSRSAEEDIEMECLEFGSGLAVEEALGHGKGTAVTDAASVKDSVVETQTSEENSNHEVELSPLEEQGSGSNMVTDAGETLNGSDVKEHVTSENSGTAENHDTDPKSTHVEDKSEVTDSKVVSGSEQDEKAMDKGQEVEADDVQVTCSEHAAVNGGNDLNEEGLTTEVSPVSGHKEDIFDMDQVGPHDEEQVEITSQQEKLEKMDEEKKNEQYVDVDEDSQAVRGMVPDSVDESELLISSDFQAETASRSTGIDVEVGDYVDDMCSMETDEIMISEMEVMERQDTDQQLSTEEYLGKDVTAGEVVTASDVHEDRDSVPGEESISNSETLELRYELLPEHEGELSLHDLVWGKVKSHPWWPGQIFESTDASEKAMKHHKKDCLLVAYFGDRSFSWNEESTLKSFRAHFSEMVDQSNGETFHNAVDCALEEVSRRVELGLACSCFPKDLYDDIRVQVIENAGIRPESNRREGLDESTGVSFFQPNKFVKYVRSLAQSSLSNSDALGLTVAKAQLLAFARFRGFSSLPEFQFCGDLVENDTAVSEFEAEHKSPSHGTVKVYKSSNKRKHDLRDDVHPKMTKEKSMSELMGDNAIDEEHVSVKRRRSGESHHGDDSTPRKTTPLSKALTPPKQSFKIGECMRRVASQMKGNAAATATTGDGNGNGNGIGNEISSQNSEGVKAGADPMEYSSLNELLFQLHSLAQDPNKEYGFSNVIVNFFSDFRNSVVEDRHPSMAELLIPDKIGGKRKKMSPETFDFDDMSDTYWTDRVIQNGAEEQPQPPQPQAQDQAQPQEPQAQTQEPQVQSQPQPQQPSARKVRKKENAPEKTPKPKRPYNRKRLSNGAASTVTPTPPPKRVSEKPLGYVSANAPTELAMIFTEPKSMPSESSLNKMFRRFGPLKEGETEVERESGRARVVFKKCSDAEVALNSAQNFSIFGAVAVVSYELNYNPVVQYKPSPIMVTLDDHHHHHHHHHHDHDDIQIDLHDMHLDLSPHEHDMELDLFEVSLV